MTIVKTAARETTNETVAKNFWSLGLSSLPPPPESLQTCGWAYAGVIAIFLIFSSIDIFSIATEAPKASLHTLLLLFSNKTVV